ncbi:MULTISPECIES: homoprotocatechuate degradation operon regulator HpaR [unclassified Undibacterium]|uniref:homoprotocatechuate degradation operon regulator HpaR n=1 Tax=unclassified Undibacterium TaxID=2630295 RepID=UPI002AC91D12|nr:MULTISPECIES: homoprotocatechuate degradation operon regulator HpaR [unclassified Undibacterium]MEB0138070.1 homoprotocatechuate degradation operon regulator HpaR [Undibacterium sp. CCC2.1]MEB0171192.1 homoprotocatechuate degradation operon regulator HpaR [Undibacterium sp. CCC1.1]MEB0175237.1 homoprotocatechuate degradation operon regulator HpaR [Undibacterium sp. CCC3.4]MEB0214645.1 homoprotocatechuate degradation operon regulator HpaR [Undibacterium sp. 5I2]WPX42412.1 homoprotocatechuate
MHPKIAKRNLPQLFLKARAQLMAHFRPILAKFGLTDQQWRILRVLDEHGRLESRELCELCQISSPSMAGVLKRMEESALICRGSFSGDQRRLVITLAPQGDALMAEIAPLIEQQYAYIEQSFGTDQIEQLLSVLEAFCQADENSVPRVLLD